MAVDIDCVEPLLETWRINNRINLYLLDAIAPEALSGVSASKGRAVGAIFAHMHNMRLMCFKNAAPDLLVELEKIEAKPFAAKEMLHDAMKSTGEAVVALLKIGFTTGKIKGFKPHPTAFVGYLIAHDTYHRREIGMTLTQAGHPLEDKISYGLWEWGAR